MTDATSDQRSRLLGIKLRALVRDHLDDAAVGESAPFAPGAALLHDDAAWVLLDDRPGRRLGPALTWAHRSGAASLQLIAESETGTLARRAAAFDLPANVWRADERTLLPAVAEPLPPSMPAPPAHEEFREMITNSGAVALVEHGVLFGEVRGLEVCRVVEDATAGAPRLEVGVGVHDREAFQMLHGDTPTAESLARIVDTVTDHRRPGAEPHPLNRLAAERLLRWRLTEAPHAVGAELLAPAPPPIPRSNLKDAVPCVAIGLGGGGERLVVVCSTGVDLDLVPYATDARLAAESAAQPGAGGEERLRLVVALPSRDRVGVTDELAGLLRHSVEFVSFD